MTHSFVIPVFGESEYLEDCIKSLLNQTVPSSILLCSSEESDFLKHIAQKYSLPYSINNNGGQIGRDWNFALSQAKTDLVTIAHQDDVYLRDFTKEVIEAFTENPKAIMSHTGYHEIRKDKVVPNNLNLKIKKLLLMPQRLLNTRFSQGIGISFGSAICCPSVTYNKEVLGDYQFNENLKSDLDWKAWVDFHQDGYRFNYLPKVLMLHRIHPKSETSKLIKDNRRQAEDIEVLKQLWPKPVAKVIELVYRTSETGNRL